MKWIVDRTVPTQSTWIKVHFNYIHMLNTFTCGSMHQFSLPVRLKTCKLGEEYHTAFATKIIH